MRTFFVPATAVREPAEAAKAVLLFTAPISCGCDLVSVLDFHLLQKQQFLPRAHRISYALLGGAEGSVHQAPPLESEHIWRNSFATIGHRLVQLPLTDNWLVAR